MRNKKRPRRLDDQLEICEEQEKTMKQKDVFIEEEGIKFRELLTEKENLKLQLNSNLEKLKELDEKNSDLEKGMKESNECQENSIKILQSALDEKTCQIVSINQEVEGITDELRQVKKENCLQAEKVDELLSDLNKHKELVTELENFRISAKNQIEELEVNKETLLKTIDGLKCSSKSLDDENSMLKENLETKRSDIDDLENKVDMLSREVVETRKQMAEKDTGIKELNESMHEKDLMLKNAKEMLEQSETTAKEESSRFAIEMQESLSRNKDELEKYKAKVQLLEGKIKELGNSLLGTQSRVTELESSELQLRDNLVVKSQDIALLTETKSSLERKCEESLNEIQKLQVEIEQKTKQISSTQLQFSSAVDKLDTLKSENKGYVNEIADLHREITGLKEKVLSEQEKSGSMTLSLQEKDNFLQRSIDESERLAKKLHDELTEKTDKITNLNAALNDSEESLRKTKELLSEKCENMASSFQDKEVILQSTIRENETRLEKLCCELAEKTENIAHLDATVNENVESIRQLNDLLSAKDNKIEEMKSLRVRLQDCVTDCENKLKDKDATIIKLEEKISQALKEKEMLHKQCAENNAEIAHLENTVKENDVTNLSLQEILQETEYKCGQMSSELDMKKNEIEQMKEETENLNNAKGNLESKYQTLSTILRDKEQTIISLEYRIQQLDNDLEEMQKLAFVKEEESQNTISSLRNDLQRTFHDRDNLVKLIQSDNMSLMEDSAVSEEMASAFQSVQKLKSSVREAREELLTIHLQRDIFGQELEDAIQQLQSEKSCHLQTSVLLVKEKKVASELQIELKNISDAKENVQEQLKEISFEGEKKGSEIEILKNVIEEMKLERSKEITVMQKSHDELVQKTKDTLQEMYKEKDELIEKQRVLNDKNLISCGKLEATEKQVLSLQKEKSELDAKILNLVEDNQSLTRQKEDLQNNLENLSQENSAHQADLAKKEETISCLTDKHALSMEQIRDIENKMQSTILEQNTIMDDLRREKEDLSQKNMKLSENMERLDKSFITLTSELSSLQEDFKQKDEQLKASCRDTEVLTEENLISKQAMEGLERTLSELKLKSENLEIMLQDKSNELANTTQKLEHTEKTLNDTCEVNTKLENECLELKDRVLFTKSAIEEKDEHFRIKEKEVDRLQNEISRMTDVNLDLQKQVRELSDKYAEEIQQSEKSQENINLLDDTVNKLKTEITSLQEFNHILENTLEEKETQLKRSEEKEIDLKKVLSETQQENKTLTESIAHLETKFSQESKYTADLLKKQDELIQSNCKLQEERETLRITLNEASQQNLTYEEYITDMKDELKSITEQLSSVNGEKEIVVKQMEFLKKQTESLKSDLEKACSDKDKLEYTARDLEISLNVKCSSLESKEEENETLSVRAAELEDENELVRQKLCESTKEKQLLEENIEALKECIEKTMTDNNCLERKAEDLNEKVEELASRNSSFEIEVEKRNKEYREMEKRLTALTRQLEDLNLENDLLSKSIKDKNEEMNNALTEISLLKSTNQSLGVSLTDTETELERLQLDLQKSLVVSQEKETLLQKSEIESQRHVADHLKVIESCSNLQNELDECTAKTTTFEKRLKDSLECNTALETKIKELEAVNKKVTEQLKNVQNEGSNQIQSLQSLVESQENQVKEKDESLKAKTKEIENLLESIDELHQSLMDRETSLKLKEDEYNQLAAANESHSQENKMINEKIFTMESQIQVLQSVIEEIQSTSFLDKELINKMSKDLQNSKKEMCKKEQDLCSFQQENKRLCDSLRKRELEFDKIHSDTISKEEYRLKEVDDLNMRIQSLQDELVQEKNQKESLVGKLSNLDIEFAVVKQYANDLENQQSELTEFISKLKREKSVNEKEFTLELSTEKDLMCDLKETLSDLLQSVNKKDEEINQLNLKLTSVAEESKHSEETLLKTCKDMEDKHEELISKTKDMETSLEKMKELKNSLLSENEQVHNERKKLAVQICELEERFSSEKNSRKSLETAIGEHEEKYRFLENQLQQDKSIWEDKYFLKNEENNTLKAQLGVLQDEYEVINLESQGKTTLLAKLKSDVQTKIRDLNKSQTKLMQAVKETEQLKITLSDEFNSKEQLSLEKRELEEEIQKLKIKVACYEENLQKMEEQCIQLENNGREIDDKNASITRRNEELEKSYYTLENKLKETEISVKNFAEKNDSAITRIKSLETVNAALEEKSAELQEMLDSETKRFNDLLRENEISVLNLKDQVTSLTESKSNVEVEKDTLQKAFENLKDENDHICEENKMLTEINVREGEHKIAMLESQCESYLEALQDTTSGLQNEKQKVIHLKKRHEEEKSRLEEEIMKLKLSLKEKVDQYDDNFTKLDGYKQNIEDMTKDIELMKRELTFKEEEIDKFTKGKTVLLKKIDEESDKFSSLREKFDELEMNLQNYEHTQNSTLKELSLLYKEMEPEEADGSDSIQRERNLQIWIDLIRTEVSNLKVKLEKSSKENLCLCAQVEQKSMDLEKVKEDLAKEFDKMEILQGKNDIISTEVEELQRALHSLDMNSKMTLTTKKKMKEKMNDQEQEISRLQKFCEQLEKAINDHEEKLTHFIELTTINSSIDCSEKVDEDDNESSLKQLERNIKLMSENILDREKDILLLKTELEKSEMLLKDLTVSNVDLLERLDRSESRLKQERLDRSESRLKQIFQEKASVDSELIKSESEYATLQEQIHALSGEKNHLATQVIFIFFNFVSYYLFIESIYVLKRLLCWFTYFKSNKHCTSQIKE